MVILWEPFCDDMWSPTTCRTASMAVGPLEIGGRASPRGLDQLTYQLDHGRHRLVDLGKGVHDQLPGPALRICAPELKVVVPYHDLAPGAHQVHSEPEGVAPRPVHERPDSVIVYDVGVSSGIETGVVVPGVRSSTPRGSRSRSRLRVSEAVRAYEHEPAAEVGDHRVHLAQCAVVDQLLRPAGRRSRHGAYG